MHDLTELLCAWAAGDRSARDHLFARVYPDLQRLAANRLLRERADISVNASELVHEAFLRLANQESVDWQSRSHFFGLTSTQLRRILVDHAKHRSRNKRGSTAVHIPFDDKWVAGKAFDVDLLALDEALTELAAIRATAARIVELRFFAGLGIDETAESLSLSRATVVRRCDATGRRETTCRRLLRLSTLTGDTSAVSTSGNYNSSYKAWKVFDNSSSSMWISETWETPAWVAYDWGSSRKINRYTITNCNGSLTSRAPKDFALQGSNGGLWVTVDSRSNQTGWVSGTPRTYAVATPGFFTRYRLHITDDNDIRTGVVVISIGDLDLIGCQ